MEKIFSINAFKRVFEFLLKGNNFLSNTIWSLVIKVGGAVILFLLHIFLARLAGEQNYGEYIYAFMWINFLAVVARFGFHQSALKYVATYNTKDQNHLLRPFIHFVNKYIIYISIFLIILFEASVWLIFKNHNSNLFKALIASGTLIPLLAFTQVQESISRGLGYLKIPQLISSILFPLLFIFLALFYVFIFHEKVISSEYLIFLHAISLIVILALFFIIIRKKVKTDGNYVVSPIVKSEWYKVSKDLLIVSGFVVLMNRADIIMVGSIIDARSSGIYSACVKIGGFISFIQLAVNYVIAPKITTLFNADKIDNLQTLVRKSTVLMFISELVISLAIILFSNKLLSYFGTGFLEGKITLIVILLSYVIIAYSGAVSLILSLTGHEKSLRNILFYSSIINIILNVFFINMWGMLGAAIATLVTTLISRTVLFFEVKKKLGINSNFDFKYLEFKTLFLNLKL